MPTLDSSFLRAPSAGRLALVTGLLATLLLGGCDGGSEQPDAGPVDSGGRDRGTDADPADARDGAADTADTSDGGDADAGPDASDGPDADVGPVSCKPGAVTESAVTADGATVELCGATLTAAAGLLPAGATLTLEIVKPPAPAPFERAFLTPIFKASASEAPQGPLDLALTTDSVDPGYREMAVYDAVDTYDWIPFEACPVEGGLRSTNLAPGIFVLLRDINVYPPNTNGLGEGTLSTTFDGETIDWTFDDGYVIHEAGENGLRSIIVIARRPVGVDGLQQLDLRITEQKGGSAALLSVSLLDTTDVNGGWSYLEPVHGPIDASALTVNAAGRTQGTFTATLHQADQTQVMSGTLDVLSEKFRFPPEGICKE